MILKILLTIALLLSPSVAFSATWCDHADIEGGWLFDEASGSADDCSSNNRDGTVESGIGYEATGVFGTGFDFSGSADTLEVTFGNIDMAGWTGFTGVAHIYWLDGGTPEHSVLSNFDASGNSAGILFRIEPSDNEIEIIIIEEPNAGVVLDPTDIDITPNKYVHITMTWEGGDALRAYTDGIVSTDTTASSANFDSSSSVADFFVGNSPHNQNDDFGGLIDEPAIFSAKFSGTNVNDIMDNGLFEAGGAARRIWMIN